MEASGGGNSRRAGTSHSLSTESSKYAAVRDTLVESALDRFAGFTVLAPIEGSTRELAECI